MTFRSLSAVRSGSLILLLIGALAATTLLASRSAYALEESGRELGHPDPGSGSDYELTNPGDDDQPTIHKRRQRVISNSGAEAPQGDTARAPAPVPSSAAPSVRQLPATIWVRIAFDLWLGMLR